MSKVFYVYEHLRNDTNKTFYVGKGKVGNSRSNCKQNRNQYWHNIVNKSGYTVHKIAEGLTEELSLKKEIDRIKELRELGIKLCNMTDGGEGVSGYKHSEETLSKLREAQSGENHPMYNKKHTEESRANMSRAQSGENNGMYNKKHTDETLVKMSEVMTGKKHSAETCAKISELMSNPSAETRAKLSKAKSGDNNPHFGKSPSAETREKNRVSQLARPKVTCPHCGKEGDIGNMTRYHFDNCKKRVVIN